MAHPEKSLIKIEFKRTAIAIYSGYIWNLIQDDDYLEGVLPTKD